MTNSIRAITVHVEEVCRLLSHSSEQPPVFIWHTYATMARQNVGGMFWEGLPGGQFAWVACRGCTTLRTSGPQLRHWVRRHGR